MDLFSYSNEKNKHHREPLASKMRPRNFDQFVGQTKLVGKNNWKKKQFTFSIMEVRYRTSHFSKDR